ncbi:MAG: hypothetical protein H0V82_03535 [Candidatus Protochlamydia sp.]|nr:hypothetical protein [Candidatus Protochlamydia sp.]
MEVRATWRTPLKCLHLADNWEAACKIINLRHDKQVSKATCLYGADAKNKLIEEVRRLMNYFSVKIGADLFGKEPKREIQIKEPISSNIKMEVAFRESRGPQHSTWKRVDFIIIPNDGNNMKMVHCVALQ